VRRLTPEYLNVSMTADNAVVRITLSDGDIVMKTIVATLIALSMLAGIAAPASALDAKKFWEQQDQNRGS
jgi:hypothetical protein